MQTKIFIFALFYALHTYNILLSMIMQHIIHFKTIEI